MSNTRHSAAAGAAASARPQSIASAHQLAIWLNGFVSSAIHPSVAERTRHILLDTLACALQAGGDETAQGALRTVQKAGAIGDCTILGTPIRSALPLAAFANGVLIRTLDFNDSYAGGRQIGHPSDNIGAALCAAELADRSGRDLLQAVRLGYEIYGRILDLGNPESPWDHVTASGVTTAAMTGWLLRLPPERIAHAVALAATHSATLGQVRVGHVSAAKSIANAMVVQTATLATLLAAEGITGPEFALEGERGFAKLLLGGADFQEFFTEGRPDRILSVGLKPFPCFALAQGPISAAIELRQRLGGSAAQLARVALTIADTGPARLRLRDESGRTPASREAADHSIYYVLSAALLDGHVGLDQFAAGRWRDDDVRALMTRIDARIDAALRPPPALPCRLEVVLQDGTRQVVERAASPGNPALPLSWDEVRDKFRRCAAGVLDADAQDRAIDLVERIEELPSVRTLLAALVPKGT
jgi:2-methylcitrate dehydratase